MTLFHMQWAFYLFINIYSLHSQRKRPSLIKNEIITGMQQIIIIVFFVCCLLKKDELKRNKFELTKTYIVSYIAIFAE